MVITLNRPVQNINLVVVLLLTNDVAMQLRFHGVLPQCVLFVGCYYLHLSSILTLLVAQIAEYLCDGVEFSPKLKFGERHAPLKRRTLNSIGFGFGPRTLGHYKLSNHLCCAVLDISRKQPIRRKTIDLVELVIFLIYLGYG